MAEENETFFARETNDNDNKPSGTKDSYSNFFTKNLDSNFNNLVLQVRIILTFKSDDCFKFSIKQPHMKQKY
jgi:hypothetical protein